MENKKVFAEQYPRTNEGWIIFPKDRIGGPRQELFPPEVMEHVAKYNFAMIESIIEYTTKPGDTIIVTPEILLQMDKEVDWCSC